MRLIQRKHQIITSGILLVCLLWSSTGFAQNSELAEELRDPLISSTFISVLIALVPLTTTGGVIGLVISNSKAVAYLEKNERNLREVATLGAGDGLGDLGAFLRLPNARHKELGKHLKKHRKEFLFVLQMKSNQQKGERFLALVAPFLPIQQQDKERIR